jgi:hypothetical protein
MLLQVASLPVGNAVKIVHRMPRGANSVRVLRSDQPSFVDAFDPTATLIYEGDCDSLVDASALNGVTYHYMLFYLIGVTWTATPVYSVTVASTYEDHTVDFQTLVLDRIRAGLAVELERGVLSHDDSEIPTLSGAPVYEDTRFPIVTVTLQSEASSLRALGEQIDYDDPEQEHEGWIARSAISIVGWSQNPDQRIALRKAIRRVVVANLPIFADAGINEIEFSQNDIDELSAYPAPIYQVAGSLSGLLPVIVRNQAPIVRSVQSTVISP